MAKLATWARIDPRAATTDINVGLAAEIADPLWLLSRQLQLGEFAGSDGGSPIDVELRTSWAPITRYRPGPVDGGAAAQDYDEAAGPLEKLVEAEQLPRGAGAGAKTDRIWRWRAIWGQRLETIFAGSPAIIDHLRTKYRFSRGGDQDGPAFGGAIEKRFLLMFEGRTDGVAALKAAENDWAELRAIGPIAETKEEADAWARDLRELLAEGREVVSAWQPERQEYAFSLGSPGFGAEVTLVAAEYHGTGLDWYHLDVGPAAAGLNAVGVVGADQQPRHFLPTPVSFSGMPADRFWEMEDGLVDLGTIDAGPTDLARMLATEYAVIYSPDWFLVPVEFPIGSLARIDWVCVTDTFGVSTLVGTHETQAADKRGRMFQLSVRQAEADAPPAGDAEEADIPFLLIPPATLYGQQSAPLENVLIERDEQANLGWIIEKSILGAAGRPMAVDPGSPPAISAQDAPADQPPDLVYQVASWVPQGWTPLVPEVLVEGEAYKLERGVLLETDAMTLRKAQSVLGIEIDSLFDEEVPRQGIRLQLVDQVVRWTDGSVHFWRGRQKLAGRGEADANLYFDDAVPPSQE